MIPDSGRTLVLMRHAKSSWSTGAPDHERPLSGRGRRDGLAAGTWLADRGVLPQLALVSSAARTRQTWERLIAGGARFGSVRVTAELYEATEDSLLTLVTETDDPVRSLIVIGHNPTIEETVRLLARRVGNHEWWAAMDERFPTSAIAVIGFDGTWADVGPGVGALLAYAVPRG